jgi:arylsulfatase A-like enzyme
MLRALRSTALIAALLACTGGACTTDEKKSADTPAGASKAKKGAPEKVSIPKQPDLRDDYQLFRSLLAEASRAELRVGGPLIDFGTSDQNKYTQGGWATGWSPAPDSKVSAALLKDGSGLLNTYLSGEPKELVVRARSTEGAQELGFAFGKRPVGAVKLTGEWQELRLPLTDLGKGRKKIKLTHKKGKAVEIDWLWLAGEVGQTVPAVLDHAGPAKIGKRLRRSLLAPGAQSLSFYLHIPKDATLIFDYASKTPLDFVVNVEGVDNKISELFRATGGDNWKSAKVDLSALAGQALRLEFKTEGSGMGGAWGEPGLFQPIPESPAPNPQDTIAKAKKAKNLVLVVMDTTRADQFETFTPGNGIHTPKLDAFSKKATSFTRAYNNGNWTKPSMLTMFSGLYPATHTATKPESMVPEGIGLISEHLQKQGLKTQGFTSNPVVSEKFGFERGWDGFGVFYEGEASGESMYKRAAKWTAENGDQPFFLYVQTIDPHTTYAVPKQYWSRYYKKNYSGQIGQKFTRDDQKKINDKVIKASADDVAWIQALYHGEISYQDEHVGYFLDQLEEQGRLEDTIVVVTNDHGEEIYDHGSFGHGWTLFEEMIRAPLMIHYPALFPKATVVDAITEHVDLAPTLVEALGLPPMKGTEGTSFLPTLHGSVEQEPRYAIAISDNGKRSIHIGNWKLEISKSKGWKYLFDMTAEKPEKRDRRQDAELAGRLCEIYMGEGMASPGKLGRLSGVGGGKRFQAQDAVMDAELRKQMEALGYL